MIQRKTYLKQLEDLVANSPVTALLGPRQCGKTTLAKEFGKSRESHYFDLESEADSNALQSPETVLGELDGLVILDEIQLMPNLFNVLRVLVDRSGRSSRFLILGSADPSLVRGVSESLAGRVDFLDMKGFDLSEVGADNYVELWLRGGFPDCFLAGSAQLSARRRNALIRTHVERDLPMLGTRIPAARVRRFWAMLAHMHGQSWNASTVARSMSVSHHTVTNYLDLLTGTYMVRQLQPWHENFGKRQIKAPKVYLRDSGLLHAFLNIQDQRSLYSHPAAGASWEGFVLEETLRELQVETAWYWAAHSGGELDLLVEISGMRIGVEVKLSEAPKVSASMHRLCDLLRLNHLFVVSRAPRSYRVSERIDVLGVEDLVTLRQKVDQLATDGHAD